MIRQFSVLMLVFASFATAQDPLRPALEKTYNMWRAAIVSRDPAVWQKVTAEHRRLEVRNRIVSEKRPFPAAVFDLPSPPPSIGSLKFLQAKQKAATAKASYFGKIDFGVGGEPTENLIVLSFVSSGGAWLYDRADFINLAALPEVRAELSAGNVRYLEETPDAQPSGTVPPTPIAANPAKTIAKVYVFCPGREVKVQINKISRHRFANAKEAEIVIGGAVDGPNEVQYAISKLEGGTGKEALTIRVYLLSTANDVKPVKAFEYQVDPGGVLKNFATGTFNLDAAMLGKLSGR